jgi:hypothetical protein
LVPVAGLAEAGDSGDGLLDGGRGRGGIGHEECCGNEEADAWNDTARSPT